MVYCDYISNTRESATYYFGDRVSDVSGIVRFDFIKEGLEIIKEPQDMMICTPKYLCKLLITKLKEFRSGTFKEKISYEI